MGRPKSSKTVLARSFDQGTFPIYLLDVERRLTYCNSQFRLWLGLSSDAGIIGTKCNYQSDPHSGSTNVLAGICPPPEAFRGKNLRASVSCTNHPEPRSALCVPTQLESPSEVIVFVDNLETDVGLVFDDTIHARIMEIRKQVANKYKIDRFVGDSLASGRIRNQIKMAQQGSSHVVVFGPPGSGREQVARTIFYSSTDNEPKRPLVPFDSRLLEPELLQSTIESFIKSCAELMLESAGALLFLDIDKLPRDAQSTLVGFLSIDELQLQVFATSSKSLIEMAGRGEFRQDLAFALSTVEIEIPPLKDRIEDIPLMAQVRLEANNSDGDQQKSGFSSEALEELVAYSWPGNIDELFEVVDQACQESQHAEISAEELSAKIRTANRVADTPVGEIQKIDLEVFLHEIELELLQRALQQTDGNKSKAASLLGINRAKLLRRIEYFGLK